MAYDTGFFAALGETFAFFAVPSFLKTTNRKAHRFAKVTQGLLYFNVSRAVRTAPSFRDES